MSNLVETVVGKFWSRDGWAQNPVACAFWTAILLGLAALAFKYAAVAAASRFMAPLAPEAQILRSIEGTVAGQPGLAKARLLVAERWPSPECDVETPDERFTRLATAIACFDAKLVAQPGASDAINAGRSAILQAAGMTPEAFLSELTVRKADEPSLGTLVEGMSPYCTPPESWEDYGPETNACAVALNKSSTFPMTAKSMIAGLLQLKLSDRQFWDAAQPFLGAEDEGGWNLFPGGQLLQSGGPHRNSIQSHIAASATDTPFRLHELRELASRVLSEEKVRSDTADKVGVQVQEACYGSFIRTLTRAVTLLLFFSLLLVFGSAGRQASGWRRFVAFLGFVAVGIALTVPGALESLDLQQAAKAFGRSEGVDSLLGAPFIAVSQILDLFGAWLSSVWTVDTVRTVLATALVGTVFFAQSRSSVIAAAYGLLLVNDWAATGTFGLLPFDVDALDAAPVPAVVGWSAWLVGFILAAFVMRGMWKLAGEAIVCKGTELLVPGESVRDTRP